MSTFWSIALIMSRTLACNLKSFGFLFPVIGYSSLLSDNDANTLDTPETPPPMPPKKHPHEIDNPGFSSEVHVLRENSKHSLMHIYWHVNAQIFSFYFYVNS